ncbi:MAG: ankyrin repeat domain-containing protein [Candidatus Tectimicrobiota bacterium]
MATSTPLMLSRATPWRRHLTGLLLCLPLFISGCLLGSRSRSDAPPPPSPLIKATAKGDIATVRTLLARGADVHARDAQGRTALSYAAENGDPTTVQALLNNGADVNARDWQGWTSLMYAAENGDVTTTQILLMNKAHVNVKAEGSGWTALMSAASRGHLPVVQALVTGGAEANTKDQDGQTALIFAVQQGHTGVVQALLDGGAEVNVTNKAGKTPLAVAEAEGFSKIAQALKQAASRAQGRDRSSATSAPPAAPPVATTRQPQASAAPRPSVNFGRYHALVIGNNAYTELGPLKTPINDAQAVAELLRNTYNFNVTLLKDASREDIIGALDRLRSTLSAQDNLLIYYAGHGRLDASEERGYWLPVNAKIESRVQWISNTTITDALKAMAAKHIMVVADSCYSGTLARGIEVVQPPPPGAERDTYLSRIAQKRSRTVLTSGGLEPVTDSGGGEHSIFAKAFIEVLRDNQDVLDGQQLFNLIRRPVILNAAQTPEYTDIRYAGHEGGDFLFVRRGALPGQAASAPPPLPGDAPGATSPGQR